MNDITDFCYWYYKIIIRKKDIKSISYRFFTFTTISWSICRWTLSMSYSFTNSTIMTTTCPCCPFCPLWTTYTSFTVLHILECNNLSYLLAYHWRSYHWCDTVFSILSEKALPIYYFITVSSHTIILDLN